MKTPRRPRGISPSIFKSESSLSSKTGANARLRKGLSLVQGATSTVCGAVVSLAIATGSLNGHCAAASAPPPMAMRHRRVKFRRSVTMDLPAPPQRHLSLRRVRERERHEISVDQTHLESEAYPCENIGA